MVNRDELIEVGRDAMGRNDGWRWWHPRHLERLLDVWEPLIRADEREKSRVHATGTSTGDGPCCQCCYDVHAAEAVAARLVKVICEQEEHIWVLSDDLGACRSTASKARRAVMDIRHERDNLRAQIATDIEAIEAGWVAYQRLPQNTSHVAFVHEDGEVYDPEYGWIDPSDILAADAKGCAYPLIERSRAARIARDGRS